MHHFAERNASIVAAIKDGRTLADVGAEHSITRERVRQIAAAAGLSPSQLRRERRKRFRAVIVAALREERSYKDIADEFGGSKATLYGIAAAEGLTSRAAPRHNPIRAYYSERVALIIAGISAGRLQQDIADELGVAQSYVSTVAVRHGLRRASHKPKTERNAAIAAAVQRGSRIADVAAEYGISPSRVQQIARREQEQRLESSPASVNHDTQCPS